MLFLDVEIMFIFFLKQMFLLKIKLLIFFKFCDSKIFYTVEK